MNCSWNLPAGQDAIIEASFYGTKGGASMKNVNGSFYDFKAEKYTGTSTEVISNPPDDWGGRAGVVWANALAKGQGFDPEADNLVKVADLIDKIYKR